MLIKVLGKKWTIKILKLLQERNRSYSEIKEELKISSRVLTDRLETLQQKGILNRKVFENRTTEYNLTDKGKNMIQLINKLEELAS